MAIKFDRTTHDDQIVLSFDDKRGIGIFEIAFTTPEGIRSYRAAQRLPTAASPHTLQLLALLAALRDVNRSLRTTITGSYQLRPRFRIVTGDAGFAEALRSLLKDDPEFLRAGGNFIDEARRVLNHFALSVAFENDHATELLRQWAQRYVPAREEIAASEAIFRHAAVGARGPHF